jgi:hypothetical protein
MRGHRGQAYAEYLVVLGVVVAVFAFGTGNDSSLARLANAVRNLYLAHVAATAAPPLPLACGGSGSTSITNLMANCK